MPINDDNIISIEKSSTSYISFRYDKNGQIIIDKPGTANIMRTVYGNAGWVKIDWTGRSVRWQVGSNAGGSIYFHGTVTVVDYNLRKNNKYAYQTLYVSQSGNRTVSGYVYPHTLVSHQYNAILNGTMESGGRLSVVLPECNASSFIR